MIFRVLLVFLLTCCIVFTAQSNPPFGKRAAYSHYFKGNVNFTKGNYSVARRHFRQAWMALPQNVNVTTSYAITLAKTGDSQQALHLLKRALTYLSPREYNYKEKRIYCEFAMAMIYCFGEQYGQAIPLLKRCIKQEDHFPHTKLISLFHNTLGYAIIQNQGKNTHPKSDHPVHTHVHRRDMEKAAPYFETALQYDFNNKVARKNYRQIMDSLGVSANIRRDSAIIARQRLEAAKHTLEDDVFRGGRFHEFEEIIFLLDISGSMVQENVTCEGKTRFKVMKKTVGYLLDEISPEIPIGIGSIGGDCGTEPKLWLSTGEQSRKELKQTVDFVPPDGTTPLLNILKDSPMLFDSTQENRRKSIFLVSDGENICSLKGISICKWADQMASQNTVINVLTFLGTTLNNANAFADYACLTEATEGRIHFIDNNYCRVQDFSFNLAASLALEVPKIEKLNCFKGKMNDNLWAIYKE